ncbi:LOG family protein [Legionella impletisoli]|uniref:Cytokinin riboside 5'-monophosphate phosphoribohydrolase n=1 Tax=Legionella impletisoli TaxID=343510 RepID=A0A917JU91_9GAMM|nr:TIGR00730 family Rossman fold protein [Legionella impletisoli]GGI82370.1 cytokinin riboside 5'-monophosphate phosphoribohydrolase [Legionella impletisoli]
MVTSICVYLGAYHGNDELFQTSVQLTALEIAKKGFTLVYGGSSLGLMGLLANTVKACGGRTVGVITNQLIQKEKPLSTLDELHIVNTMQERKQFMQQKADMFLVMPGGLGTLEEAFDTWNAIKIGLFDKPIGFLNVAGYFDDLFKFILSCKNYGFVSDNHCTIPKMSSNITELLTEMISTSLVST